MLCEHGNIAPCVECDIEPLKAENEALRALMVGLVEALEDARLTLKVMQGRGSIPRITISTIDQALAAYHKQGVRMTTDKNKTINYVVSTQGWRGKKVTECETEDEVWAALSNCGIGSLTNVSSPTGKSVDKFVPF